MFQVLYLVRCTELGNGLCPWYTLSLECSSPMKYCITFSNNWSSRCVWIGSYLYPNPSKQSFYCPLLPGRDVFILQSLNKQYRLIFNTPLFYKEPLRFLVVLHQCFTMNILSILLFNHFGIYCDLNPL